MSPDFSNQLSAYFWKSLLLTIRHYCISVRASIHTLLPVLLVSLPTEKESMMFLGWPGWPSRCRPRNVRDVLSVHGVKCLSHTHTECKTDTATSCLCLSSPLLSLPHSARKQTGKCSVTMAAVAITFVSLTNKCPQRSAQEWSNCWRWLRLCVMGVVRLGRDWWPTQAPLLGPVSPQAGAHVQAGLMVFIEQFFLLYLLNRTVTLEATCDWISRHHIFKHRFSTTNDWILVLFVLPTKNFINHLNDCYWQYIWPFVVSFFPSSEEVQETEFNSHQSPVVKTMIKGPPPTHGKNLTFSSDLGFCQVNRKLHTPTEGWFVV